MKMIVAVDENWGIGCRNHLLISIPGDMKFFREKTRGAAVIMGRKTLESFPGGQPLKGRTNIVLTRNRTYRKEGAVIVHDQSELTAYLEDHCQGREVYCIGGESIYRLLLPLADLVYVTKIDRAYEADAHFPNLDRNPDFCLEEEGEELSYLDITYRFLMYKRR